MTYESNLYRSTVKNMLTNSSLRVVRCRMALRRIFPQAASGATYYPCQHEYSCLAPIVLCARCSGRGTLRDMLHGHLLGGNTDYRGWWVRKTTTIVPRTRPGRLFQTSCGSETRVHRGSLRYLRQEVVQHIEGEASPLEISGLKDSSIGSRTGARVERGEHG